MSVLAQWSLARVVLLGLAWLLVLPLGVSLFFKLRLWLALRGMQPADTYFLRLHVGGLWAGLLWFAPPALLVLLWLASRLAGGSRPAA